MPAGLQIWDASGNLVLDTSTRLGRVLGMQLITPGQNGSLNHAGFSQGTPFWHAMGDYGSYAVGPYITVSGTTLSWQWLHTASGNWRIIYGVY